MIGKAAAQALGPGALLLAVVLGVAGCNTGADQAAKPVIAVAPRPEPTLDQARAIAMSGIAAIGGGYRVTLDADGSGRAWRDGVPGVVPVAWSVLDSSKTTLPRPSGSNQPDISAPAVDPATGRAAPPPPTGSFAICVELPVTLDIAGGHYKCALARDWKTQPRAAAPADTAQATTAPKPAPAANAGQ